MHYLVVNNSFVVIDYLRNKEFYIQKNQLLFLEYLFKKKIIFSLKPYSILLNRVIAHFYSLVYSSSHFVDYRSDQQVKFLEENFSKKRLSMPKLNQVIKKFLIFF